MVTLQLLPREAVCNPSFWRISPPVPLRVKPVREVAERPVDDSTYIDLEAALEAIAVAVNTGTIPMGRDRWRDMLFGIHDTSAGDEWGRDLAHAWSQSIPDYDEHEVDKIWDNAEPGKGVGRGSVFHLASTECGWINPATSSPPDPDAFEVVAQTEQAPGGPTVLELPTYAREKNGEIKPLLRNVLAAMRRPDVCGYRISHDEFLDDAMVCAYPDGTEWRPLKDGDLVTIRETLEFHGFKQAPKELIRDATVQICMINRFDSAIDWLRGIAPTWDGVRRVDGFLATYMGAADTPYTRAVSRYMWTALAGRVLQPGVKADMAPIYEGLQGVKKSTVIAALAPRPEMYAELELSDKDDDLARKMKGVVVCELGELSGMAARELEWTKKFQSRTKDKWVPKFMERATTYDRRSLNIGSTNKTDILVDDTGNRRWLPVHVERADVEGIIRDRDQMWAEGAALFEGKHPSGHVGGVAWEEAEKLAPAEHEAYMVRDAWEAPIKAWLAEHESMPADDGLGAGPRGDGPVVLNELMLGALNMSVRDLDRASQKRACSILKTLGYVGGNARIGGVQVWAWSKMKR